MMQLLCDKCRKQTAEYEMKTPYGKRINLCGECYGAPAMQAVTYADGDEREWKNGDQQTSITANDKL